MHEGYGIDHVQEQEGPPANVFFRKFVVIVRIGVGDAAAAWDDAVESTLIHRLQEGGYGARPRDLLGVDQLL